MSKKYISGRVQRTPQDKLRDDRYKYLNVEQSEPNLGDPVENTYHNVTDASYNPTSGDLTLTIGTHTLEVYEPIGIVGAVGRPHGCEFSPSGGKMYVTGWGPLKGGVYQFIVAFGRSWSCSTLYRPSLRSG